MFVFSTAISQYLELIVSTLQVWVTECPVQRPGLGGRRSGCSPYHLAKSAESCGFIFLLVQVKVEIVGVLFF